MEKRRILFGMILAAVIACLTGCSGKTKDGNEKIKDIEFTVL